MAAKIIKIAIFIGLCFGIRMVANHYDAGGLGGLAGAILGLGAARVVGGLLSK